MIEVFKTNVVDPNEAERLSGLLEHSFPGYKVNFDIQDCDHILRVNTFNVITDIDGILKTVAAAGYSAEVLQGDAEFDRTITLFAIYQQPKNIPPIISREKQ